MYQNERITPVLGAVLYMTKYISKPTVPSHTLHNIYRLCSRLYMILYNAASKWSCVLFVQQSLPSTSFLCVERDTTHQIVSDTAYYTGTHAGLFRST